jgi:zinc transport system permease protein
MSFLGALAEHGFLQLALAAGLVSAVGCGVVGTLVVVKRMAFMAGGVAHAVLGGIGLAVLLQRPPLAGAAVGAVIAALLIGWIGLRARQREDMLIGAVWASGMAIGILAIAATPGYANDLMSYLLGNLLMVTREQVIGMALLDALIVGLLVALYRPVVAVAFDEEFARLRGLPTTALHLALLVVVALAVVVLVHTVGLVLVMALLTLPAATALLFGGTLARLMVVATLVAAVVIVAGLGVAFEADVPAGATIVLIAALVYLFALGLARVVSRRRAAHATPGAEAERGLTAARAGEQP